MKQQAKSVASTLAQCTHVTIPEATVTSDKEGKKFVLYRITVKDNSATWSIKKRYREFHELHLELRHKISSSRLPPFPPKSFFSDHLSRDFIKERKNALEKYMQVLVQQCDGLQYSEVLHFLDHYARNSFTHLSCVGGNVADVTSEKTELAEPKDPWKANACRQEDPVEAERKIRQPIYDRTAHPDNSLFSAEKDTYVPYQTTGEIFSDGTYETGEDVSKLRDFHKVDDLHVPIKYGEDNVLFTKDNQNPFA
mmetsp:Transcript_38829/g.97827  ORF Transcript_38829/g.97827 Transcript_38829/m.97827 type:complete len:252 (-) Transcript_38829:444-1199(-)|eukprot:CAMPEP_0177635598 /NCGR_PEP_ID=MMETSP0447-20121125/3990_1 /TAXON_ID=0 /ORGANISM="Stygamoeba regulata, Strain BSH-02190019" /LENGTH=251 /DNA_ID=CAMNT_0019137403 /DNA_START=343 /DNA_END=1098 /DNA_ORIENTATION=-